MIKFPQYFEVYGGLNSLVKSKYFWCAIALTLVCSRFFLTPSWWELATSVIPGLVGFSIAGVAIFVSLGSDSLRAVIAGKEPGDTEESPFVQFMAMFTHFIVVQLAALIFALVADALYSAKPIANNPLADLAESIRPPFWLLGGLLFLYAIFLCIALAVEIYRLATLIDRFQTAENLRIQQKKESD